MKLEYTKDQSILQKVADAMKRGEEARPYHYTGADGQHYSGCEKSPVKAWGMVK